MDVQAPGLGGLSRPVRQAQNENGAACGRSFAGHGSAVALRDRPDQREPQADAAIAFGGARKPVKGLENPLA